MSQIKRLIKEWKARPLRAVIAIILVCLSVLWLIMGLIVQAKWADWLFAPMLLIIISMIVTYIKERNASRTAGCIASLLTLVALALPRLFAPENPEHRMWMFMIPMIAAIILNIINIALSKDDAS